MSAFKDISTLPPPAKRVRLTRFYAQNKPYLSLFLLFVGYLMGIAVFAHVLAATAPGFLSKLVSSLSNPFVGLFAGLLIVSVVQRTSLAIVLLTVLASAGLLTIRQAVPIVIGINIGVTLTHNIISFARTPKRREFRRVIALATVHSFFSICVALAVFPLEYFFGTLSKITLFLTADVFAKVPAGFGFFHFLASPLDFLLTVLGGYAWVLLVLSAGLLVTCFRLFSQQMKELLASRAGKQLPGLFLEKPVWQLLLDGMLAAIAIQSGVMTVSLIIPFIIHRKITLRRAYPFIVGAYLGATIAPLLVAFLLLAPVSVQVALGHFLFVGFGVLLFFPFPVLRYLPVSLSRYLATLTIRNRTLGLVYLLVIFFLLPFFLILLTR